MSILNLNTPQGRGPAGKKSAKLWMGVGLLAAVLGFGSTLAASISINNSNESEFGQGFTETVYCGANNPTKITVTPISSFVNSTVIPAVSELRSWVPAVGAGPSFKEVSERSDSTKYLSTGVTYIDTATGLTVTGGRGYWIRSRTSDDYYQGSPVTTAPTRDSTTYSIFVPQVRTGSSTSNYKYGFYEYDSWSDGRWRVDRAAVETSTTQNSFDLGGIKLSDIPAACVGVDFIISAYGSGSSPLELSDDLNVTEVAVNYAADSSPGFSFDRTTPGATTGYLNKVAVTMDEGWIKVTFTPEAGRLLTESVTKVIVETQENIVGN